MHETTATPALKINLLGTVELFYEGEPLHFSSRKGLALLVYLVVTQQRHRRASLITLLWPESDEKRGRTSLRTAVTRLRQALGTAKESILAKGDFIEYDANFPAQIDLHNLDVSDPNSDQLTTALNAYRGDFAAGFSLPDAPQFDDWIAQQRSHWQQKIGTVFNEAVRSQINGGNYAEAVRIGQQWTTFAPLSEEAYRGLIEATLLSGDRPAAMQAFQHCVTMLQEEFGLSPSDSLKKLREKIETEADDRSRPAEKLAPTASGRFTLPFVGRQREHQEMVTAFGRAVQGELQVIALQGEAGSGKTRLAETFLEWLTLQDTDILTGRAFEMAGQLPYQPIVDAFRKRIDAENAPDDLLADVWLAELTHLFPELRDRYPDLPLPYTGDADFVRSRIFEALSRLGVAFAARRPFLLFLDDFQWADEGSYDLLLYLTQHWAAEAVPAVILLTLRQESITVSPRIAQWLLRVGREATQTTIILPLLTREAVEKMISSATGATDENAAQFGRWLWGETQGHPFFIESIWQMLQEQGLLKDEGGPGRGVGDLLAQLDQNKRLPIPHSMREVLLARLSQISRIAHAMLLAAAVVGRACRYELLCAVAGVDPLNGLDALESLLDGRLLKEDAQENPYTFAHDVIREIIYTQAGEARRTVYHQRILKILEPAEAPASELLVHARAAKQPLSTFAYALLAAEMALDRYATAEALSYLEEGLQLQTVVTLEAESIQRLYQLRGEAQQQNHDYVNAFDNYRTMLTVAEALKSDDMKLAALIAQANLFSSNTELANVDDAQKTIESALRLARDLGDVAVEAKGLWCHQKMAFYLLQDYDAARQHGEAALVLARKHQLEETTAYVLNDMIRVYLNSGMSHQAAEVAQEARLYWRRLNNKAMLADNLNISTAILYEHGRFDDAIANIDEAYEIATAINNVWNQASSKNHFGKIYHELGRFDTAVTMFKECLALSEEANASIYLGFAHLHLAITYLTCNDIANAESNCRFTTSNQAFSNFITPMFKAVETWLYLEQGDLEKGKACWEEVGFKPEDILAFPSIRPIVACKLALACDNLTELHRIADQYIESNEETKNAVTWLPDFYLLKGKGLLREGKTLAAHEAVEKGYLLAKEIKLNRILWQMAAELADLKEGLGEGDAATELRQEARAALETIVEMIPEGELRASFVALPTVRQVLNKTQ